MLSCDNSISGHFETCNMISKNTLKMITELTQRTNENTVSSLKRRCQMPVWQLPVQLVTKIYSKWCQHWSSNSLAPGRQRAISCLNVEATNCTRINSLWPSDAIWWHRTGSPLAQVWTCCLTAPSHYVNQCWLNIDTEAQWQSPEGNFTRGTRAINY